MPPLCTHRAISGRKFPMATCLVFIRQGSPVFRGNADHDKRRLRGPGRAGMMGRVSAPIETATREKVMFYAADCGC